jgi:SAM-dependent methyltransferase
MKIQIGAGSKPLDGFVNVEPRATTQPNYRWGHAYDLSFAEDESVDVIFGNAFFEHLYLCQVGLAITEWKRVLRPDGQLVILGIPDFARIARLYLDKAPGITLPTFDIFEVYRYTHGFPEASIDPRVWPDWSPSQHLNDAPMDWLPQLHKGIYDSGLLFDLFHHGGFDDIMVASYAWPGETHRTNLAVFTPDADRTPFADFIDFDSWEYQ